MEGRLDNYSAPPDFFFPAMKKIFILFTAIASAAAMCIVAPDMTLKQIVLLNCTSYRAYAYGKILVSFLEQPHLRFDINESILYANLSKQFERGSTALFSRLHSDWAVKSITMDPRWNHVMDETTSLDGINDAFVVSMCVACGSAAAM